MTAVGGSSHSDVPWEDDDEHVDVGEGTWEYSDSDQDDDQVATLLFTATNPPGTVAATALMDGRIIRVELSPQVTRMTESQLAEEITVMSRLARRQAQAAQHAIAAQVMHELGHDGASTRSYLERTLSLPSPQAVLAEKLHVFAARYVDEHD
jgi:hypothetical protein